MGSSHDTNPLSLVTARLPFLNTEMNKKQFMKRTCWDPDASTLEVIKGDYKNFIFHIDKKKYQDGTRQWKSAILPPLCRPAKISVYRSLLIPI
jgi:hypothetical protein